MEDIIDILKKFKIPTFELRSEVLQKLLLNTQKKNKSSEIDAAVWDEILKELWNHLHKKLNTFDDQLLCATCFYTILINSEKKEYYMQNISELIANYADDEKDIVISLIYGLCQSSFLSVKNPQSLVLCPLLQAVFDLLLKMGYLYSKHTFIVFKTISSLKKQCGTELQVIVFNEINQIKLLNLLNHNWENPITGVRDLIKDIFQTLLTILNENIYIILIGEIREYYWNKAKYLMLSKILEVNRSGTEKVINKKHLVEGLMKSLHKTGLVSAGADLYYAILKNINNETEWCDMFLKDIIRILSSSSTNKAIENFNNYWLLITFKKFPSLFPTITGELVKTSECQFNQFAILFVMKQANKLGLLQKNFERSSDKEFSKMIFNGLQSSDTQIRMLAFDIICVSNKKSMPTTTEYNFVLDFIKFNINSDCTVLRICMLNSLTIFLTQLHISFINHLKTEQEEQNMYDFCLKFQEIVITSINLKGNYQRKITCIKLATIFLTSLREIPRKRQKQTKQSISTVVDSLKSKNILLLLKETNFIKVLQLLHDPAEDIRDYVIELLLNNYSANIRERNLIENLIESATTKNASKFFYDINCGQSIYKLVANIMLRNKLKAIQFKSAEEMFEFAYNELISEYNLQRDIVDSIENGKQLHALISSLYTILKASYQNGYEIAISQDKMITLLKALETISHQFAWESVNSTSSDFSQISEKIEFMVKKSNFSRVDADITKLSGLHQIVLNCLWLNVKASCDMAALLIRHKMESQYQVELCEKSLNIIVRVLETCRHKGAIEAAGVALGQSIRHLTSTPENLELAKLPYLLLEGKLTQLISEAGKMASITRRGAGLSIMVHRIVANDMKKGKPLFHYFMKTLLEACKKTEDTQVNDDVDNEKDLPKAIFIHFLTRIVTDSSLASDTMYYAPELAELAFDNLINKYWQIRNAALQLYGSLVPKLIGQKKQSGTEDETVATVACDELRTHFPKMWNYMITKLQDTNESDNLQYHSNLVPILNILANMAPRYNFSWDMEREKDKILLNSLFLILDSPIYTVRRLTAKCIFNIFDYGIVLQQLLYNTFVSENFLHGCLMLLSCFENDLKNSLVSCEGADLITLKLRFSSVFSEKRPSYLCKTLFENLFIENVDHSFEKFKEIIFEATENTHLPGAHLWKRKQVEYYLTYSNWEKVPEIVNVLIKTNDFEYCCKVLLEKIDNQKSDDHTIKESMMTIVSILINFEQKFNSSIVWELLYKISLKVPLDNLVTYDILYYFQSNAVAYKLRYMIPLIVRLSSKEHNDNLIKISNIIYTLTNADTTDIEMRYISAIANNEIAKVFHKVPDCVKITAISSAVVLLQDEEDEIRNLSVECYKSISNEEITLHSYVCLQRILDKSFLENFLTEELIRDLSSSLQDFITMLLDKPEIDELNPFSNDSKNIYLEVNVLQKLVNDLNS